MTKTAPRRHSMVSSKSTVSSYSVGEARGAKSSVGCCFYGVVRCFAQLLWQQYRVAACPHACSGRRWSLGASLYDPPTGSPL